MKALLLAAALASGPATRALPAAPAPADSAAAVTPAADSTILWSFDTGG